MAREYLGYFRSFHHAARLNTSDCTEITAHAVINTADVCACAGSAGKGMMLGSALMSAIADSASTGPARDDPAKRSGRTRQREHHSREQHLRHEHDRDEAHRLVGVDAAAESASPSAMPANPAIAIVM